MRSYEKEKISKKEEMEEEVRVEISSLELNDKTKKELNAFKNDLKSFGGALFKDFITGGRENYAGRFCEKKVREINGEIVAEEEFNENLPVKNEPVLPPSSLVKLNLHAIPPKISNALLSIRQNKKKSIKLTFLSLTTDEVKTIANELMVNTALLSLNLSKNSLNSESVIVLVEALKKTSI